VKDVGCQGSQPPLNSSVEYQKWRARQWNMFCAANVKSIGFLESVASGADIPLNCRLKEDCFLPHSNGVVIHPAGSIGPNCLLLFNKYES